MRGKGAVHTRQRRNADAVRAGKTINVDRRSRFVYSGARSGNWLLPLGYYALDSVFDVMFWSFGYSAGLEMRRYGTPSLDRFTIWEFT